MKYGRVNIKLFEILDEIWLRSKGDRNNVEWAEASDMPLSRISELRRLARHKFDMDAVKQVGRACSLDKISSLLSGLINIFGGEFVKKEILRRLDQAKTDKERNLIMVLLLDNGHDKELRVILEGMLRSSTYSSKNGKS
jgi:hypothetical protein